MREHDRGEGRKRGNVKCPSCGSNVKRGRPDNHDTFSCSECSWKCDWPTYRKTFKGTLLNPGAIEMPCREYLRTFPLTKNYGAKIVLIDTLIHLIHGEIGGGNKPGAYAFIEGEISDVAEFLDQLTYGSDIPEEVRTRREKWRKTVGTATRFWSDQIHGPDDE